MLGFAKRHMCQKDSDILVGSLLHTGLDVEECFLGSCTQSAGYVAIVPDILLGRRWPLIYVCS